METFASRRNCAAKPQRIAFSQLINDGFPRDSPARRSGVGYLVRLTLVFPLRRCDAHGGAIAVAIVSEYVVPARSAEPNSNTTSDRRGVRGETDAGESPIACIQRRISEIVAKLREPERPP